MDLSVNQILVICLIIVLVIFVAVLGNMGVHVVSLLKKAKVLVNGSQELVNETKTTVGKVGDNISSSASSLVANADTTTKIVTVAATGLVAFSLIKGILRWLFGGKKRKAAKAVKKSRKELKAAKKNAKKARKLQKGAIKAAKMTLK